MRKMKELEMIEQEEMACNDLIEDLQGR